MVTCTIVLYKVKNNASQNCEDDNISQCFGINFKEALKDIGMMKDLVLRWPVVKITGRNDIHAKEVIKTLMRIVEQLIGMIWLSRIGEEIML
jgi:hypothetical protein